jgi:hypothetical protein
VRQSARAVSSRLRARRYRHSTPDERYGFAPGSPELVTIPAVSEAVGLEPDATTVEMEGTAVTLVPEDERVIDATMTTPTQARVTDQSS